MRELKFRCVNITGAIIYSYRFFDLSDFFDYVSKEGMRVEQFTGLHDKNGIEVYEGDIIRIWLRNIRDEDIGWRGIVAFGEHSVLGQDVYTCFAYGWYLNPIDESDEDEHGITNLPGEAEVVGNIHENRELC